MSRYEDRLKLDQLGNFLEEKKYDKALEIVQEFDIDKIKETRSLSYLLRYTALMKCMSKQGIFTEPFMSR